MPAENALACLRGVAARRKLPPVIVIFGPHAFLREFVLDSIVRALAADGLKHRGVQIGAGDDYGELLHELREIDLFAPRRAIVGRILKSRRERADEGDAPGEPRAGGGAGEGALAAAIEDAQIAGCLVLLYEKDSVPAKVRRAAEKSALMVNCMRPFDNQIDQYVNAMVQSLGVKLAPAALDLLIARHGGDLAAIANAIAKAAAIAETAGAIQPADVEEPGSRRAPEVFELAETIARGRGATAVMQLERAIAFGRDPFELIAVEIIPQLRRMMIASAMLAARRGANEVASALGLAPQSRLAASAIDGARRYDRAKLERAYWRACEIDVGFKNGEMKERGETLAGLLLDLMA